MNRFLYLLFILMAFYFNAEAKDLVLVKYSKLDCVLCNMQVYNLVQKVGTSSMIVVFKSESSSDQSIDEIKKQLAERSITIIYSDSLFYFADSSNRSMVYVIKNDSVTYSDYLKTFDPVESSPLNRSTHKYKKSS